MTLQARLVLALLPSLLVLFVLLAALTLRQTDRAVSRAFEGPDVVLRVAPGVDGALAFGPPGPEPARRALPLPPGDTLDVLPKDGTPWLLRWRGDRLYATSAPIEHLTGLTRDLAGTYFAWGAALLLVAWAVGAWGLARSLRPLRRLSRDIAARTPDRLDPIPLPDLPELRPAVGALNALLAETRAALQRRAHQEAAARRFAFGASHELRNPLAAIRTYLDVLRRAPNETRALDGAVREALRTEQVLAALLDLARLEGRGRANAEDVPLAAFVREHLGAAPGPDVVVHADPTLLEVALKNLWHNAERHGGAARVTAGVDGGGVWIWVEDEGPGFDPAVLPRAFEPFVKRGNGTGLGLSLVAAVASAHGGRVHAENSRGGGAKVGVWFPSGEP